MSDEHQREDIQATAGEGLPPPVQTGTTSRLITALVVLAAIGIGFVFARHAVTSGLLFLVIIVALVVVHELAHFATAKLFGVFVHEFGVGFPPRVWGKRIGETEYTINWLPIGGFVRLMGEEDPTDPRSLARKPRWQRFIVLVSGALANLILPIFLFAAAFSLPHEEAAGRVVIAEVVPGAPAEVAGLQQGDIIFSIAGRNAKNISEVSRYVQLNVGKTIDFEVLRAGEFVTIPVYSRWTPPAGQGPTGITIGAYQPFTETVAMPPWESIPQGVRATWDTLLLARNEVIRWFKGGSGPELAGPVRIAQATGELASQGETTLERVTPLLGLAALISINLGIINLLPLPMLDGGRVFFLLLEVARRGKRVRPEREALVHFIGLVAFIVLALVITFADISRIVSGEPALR
jgi:regulator of sigma E protease